MQSSYVTLKTKARSKCTVGHCDRKQNGMFEGQTQPVLRLYTHRRAWRFIVKTLAPASAACEEPYCECQTVWRSQDLNQFKYSPGVLKTFFSEKFVECNGTGFINGKWGYEVRKVCRPAMRWDESLKQLVVWRNRSSQLIIRHSSTALLPLVVCRDGNVTEGWRETEVTEVLSCKRVSESVTPQSKDKRIGNEVFNHYQYIHFFF